MSLPGGSRRPRPACGSLSARFGPGSTGGPDAFSFDMFHSSRGDVSRSDMSFLFAVPPRLTLKGNYGGSNGKDNNDNVEEERKEE